MDSLFMCNTHLFQEIRNAVHIFSYNICVHQVNIFFLLSNISEVMYKWCLFFWTEKTKATRILKLEFSFWIWKKPKFPSKFSLWSCRNYKNDLCGMIKSVKIHRKITFLHYSLLSQVCRIFHMKNAMKNYGWKKKK